MQGKAYTEAKRVEVVTTYLALGKAPMVSAVTGVPSQTIRQWKCETWWKELEDEIRREETAELDSKLSRIVNRSLDVVVDRIENGDFILDSRSGTIKRVPVKMRDVHKVSIDLIDKRQLIMRKKATEIDKSTIEDVLLKLAGQFAEFSKFKKTKLIDAVSVVEENDYPIYDERAQGLSTGESVGSQTRNPDEGSSGTQPSPSNDGEEGRTSSPR